MRRREFIKLLGGLAVVQPLSASAQLQPGNTKRVGYLSLSAGGTDEEEAFEEPLRHLGWVKGRNITIEYRYTKGQQNLIPSLIREMAGLKLDVLVAWGPQLALPAKRAIGRVPLVFLITFDPVALGLVSNMAHPGGNVTGITSLSSLGILSKRLELLKELLPSLTQVAVLVSVERNRSAKSGATLNKAAETLDVKLQYIEVQTPSDLVPAKRRAKEKGAEAIYVWPSGFAFAYAKQISHGAIINRLPSIHPFRQNALVGGLLAYAADLREEVKRGAAYVDKILRGTPPGDLPVEQLSRYELVINLETAKLLGLAVPPTLLARADEVIE